MPSPLDDLVDDLAGAAVLELGCGRAPWQGATFGLDRDAGAAGVASLRLPCVVGDAARVPFGDGVFDAVVARGVLHHVPDIAAVLREAHRVLLPGGRLLVLECAPMSERDFEEMVRQLVAAGVEPEPRNGVAPDAIRALARASAFVRCESFGAGHWTNATPPYTDREFTSPAWLHVMTR